MAKIRSSKFSTAKKKKIASTKFPTSKRKLSSGKLATQTAKIPSRKFAKAKELKAKVAPAPLGQPTDEQDREKVVTTLKNRTETIMSQKVEKR